MSLTCKDCNGPTLEWWSNHKGHSDRFHSKPRSGGSIRSRCRRCHTEYVKSRPAYQAKLKPSVIPCRTCGVNFDRGLTRRTCYCSIRCRQVAEREQMYSHDAKRKLAPRGEPYTLADLIERATSRCHLCGELVNCSLNGSDPQGPTVDHLVPISLGGADCSTNVKLAHRLCNIRRHNRPLSDVVAVAV